MTFFQRIQNFKIKILVGGGGSRNYLFFFLLFFLVERGGVGAGVCEYFTKNHPNLKKIFFFEGGGLELVIFFSKNPKLKKKNFLGVGGWGVGWGVGLEC